jgi:hypothetical protein
MFMHNLIHRLCLSLLAATIALGFGGSVLAKPQSVAKVVSTKLPTRSATTNDISRPPVDAVLANVRLKPATAKVGRKNPVKTNRPAPNARSLQGISHLTDNTDRPITNVSPVDRLIQ